MSDFNKVLFSGRLQKPIVWVGMTTMDTTANNNANKVVEAYRLGRYDNRNEESISADAFVVEAYRLGRYDNL